MEDIYTRTFQKVTLYLMAHYGSFVIHRRSQKSGYKERVVLVLDNQRKILSHL